MVAVLCFLSFTSITAQKNVILEINHFLGENSFNFSQMDANNMDHNFEVTRLQYYLSEIAVIHDGGQETMIQDLYALVDAGELTSIDLGTVDVTSIEGISFHVGVDEANNHLDPASWPTDHALYPKFPSMHWGWAAGYRFLVIEGNAGSNLNNLFQLHGLGDKNYFKSSVLNSSIEKDGAHYIYVDADYTRGIEDISISSGVISHGETGEAQKAVENFRDYVFGPGSAPSGIIENNDVKELAIYPNPIIDGTFKIVGLPDTEGTILIRTASGQLVHSVNFSSNGLEQEIYMETPGIYFIQVFDQGHFHSMGKLIKL